MAYTVVYGGSFDPFHRGHIAAASMIAADVNVDKVLIVPSAAHPEKKDLAPYEARYGLICLAMLSDNKLMVSRAEHHMLAARHEGPIYTYDLLCYLRDTHKDGDYRFAVGPDLLDAHEKWEKGDLIARDFGFYELPDFGAVRSTTIRQCVKDGLPITNYTPPAIAHEIRRQGLYRD